MMLKWRGYIYTAIQCNIGSSSNNIFFLAYHSKPLHFYIMVQLIQSFLFKCIWELRNISKDKNLSQLWTKESSVAISFERMLRDIEKIILTLSFRYSKYGSQFTRSRFRNLHFVNCCRRKPSILTFTLTRDDGYHKVQNLLCDGSEPGPRRGRTCKGGVGCMLKPSYRLSSICALYTHLVQIYILIQIHILKL